MKDKLCAENIMYCLINFTFYILPRRYKFVFCFADVFINILFEYSVGTILFKKAYIYTLA